MYTPFKSLCNPLNIENPSLTSSRFLSSIKVLIETPRTFNTLTPYYKFYPPISYNLQYPIKIIFN